MFGAIIGDIVGSRFEFFNNKTGKEFKLFHEDCRYTDDSIMSLAICKALVECDGDYKKLSEKVILNMQCLGGLYPCAGYGGMFSAWLNNENPKPYNSFGNGAAMRISAVAYVAETLEEVKRLSKLVTEVTHNHPEGIKGAEAVAVAIFLARIGKDKKQIKDYIEKNYYVLDFTIDEIKEEYEFNETCQGSVPQALECFFESTGFEDAIRIAISLGGDSDTIAAITGSVAEAYYGVPSFMKESAICYLDKKLFEILKEFENYWLYKLRRCDFV